MNDSTSSSFWRQLAFQPALIGTGAGAAFYFVIVQGIPWESLGPAQRIGEVMSDWISLFTFMAFGAAVALLIARAKRLRRESRPFFMNLMGDDPDALLLPDDARAYRNDLRDLDQTHRELIVVRLLDSGLQRARANWSAEDVSTAIHASAGIIRDEIDATYSTTRYLAWAIPSIGFVGTVLGIGQAMAAMKFSAGDADGAGGNPLDAAAGSLSTAFNTTLVALVLSLILMFILHRVQADDDRLLARATDWVLTRLPLRMHTAKEVTL